MCIPLAVVPAVIAGVSAAASIAGGAISMANQAAADEKNKKELEKAVQSQNAARVDALVRGSAMAGQLRMQGAQLAAKQRLGYLASGVEASSGTAAAVVGSTGLYTEMDATTAINNAWREAHGHEQQAGRYSFAADQIDSAAANRNVAFGFQTAGSVLGAASGVYGSYKKFN